MGTEIRSRLLIVTPGRFSGDALPPRFEFHCRRPVSQSANACKTVVLPELLGPIRTTALPSSISTSAKRLKLRILRLVSMCGSPLWGSPRHASSLTLWYQEKTTKKENERKRRRLHRKATIGWTLV